MTRPAKSPIPSHGEDNVSERLRSTVRIDDGEGPLDSTAKLFGLKISNVHIVDAKTNVLLFL
jgi:hypothetical protein